MKEQYIQKNFTWATEIVIDQANAIISEYQKSGMKLTLRQLYYQFVSRDLIANKQQEYARLGRIITDARMCGLIDWSSIEDRTRNLKRVSTWRNPGEIIETCVWSFKLDYWENQESYIEVWIEKEALIGVIESVCHELRVGWFACKGYVSKSEMYASAKRMNWRKDRGKKTIIIHLGDHDPSGMDMTRDITDQHVVFDGAAEVIRIALNMDQIEQYNPPPNPTKMKDSRSSDYVSYYGTSCWELDALDPLTIENLIRDTVLNYRNPDIHDIALKKEQEYKDILQKVANEWETL